ncbi:MAG: spore coat protein U domain-containing protein [Sideroxydans sp.]|nr:spore coat protein U domain-containing protein [Sideroxydans sp.]
MKKFLLTASILASSLAFSGVAQAVVVASATLNVSATVAVDCTVTTTAVNFGNLNATQISTASGDVSVTCTTGTPYTITLDAGLNLNTTNNLMRHMKNTVDGVSLAQYHLSANPASPFAYYSSWGDAGWAGTYPWASGVVTDTSNGVAQPHPVYGQAIATNASNQPAPAGAYSDIVNVTVNY